MQRRGACSDLHPEAAGLSLHECSSLTKPCVAFVPPRAMRCPGHTAARPNIAGAVALVGAVVVGVVVGVAVAIVVAFVLVFVAPAQTRSQSLSYSQSYS